MNKIFRRLRISFLATVSTLLMLNKDSISAIMSFKGMCGNKLFTSNQKYLTLSGKSRFLISSTKSYEFLVLYLGTNLTQSLIILLRNYFFTAWIYILYKKNYIGQKKQWFFDKKYLKHSKKHKLITDFLFKKQIYWRAMQLCYWKKNRSEK